MAGPYRLTLHPVRYATLVAAVTTGLLAAGTVVGSTQSPLPAGSPGRFTMHPAEGGVLRLDTQTGAISMCKQAASGWSCALVPDDRTAMADEADRLRSENAELKIAIKRLEDLNGVPAPNGPDAGAGRPRPGVQLPTEEDVDKAMSYVERMLKKFKDKLKELEGPDGRRSERL